MKYLSALSVFCCAKGDRNEVTIKEPIQVDSSAGIYMIILVIGVIAVVMWEIAKAALRKVNPAARLRSLAAGPWTPPTTRPQRLTTSECNELSSLMLIPTKYLSDRQSTRIRELAARITATSGPTARASSTLEPPHLVYGQSEATSSSSTATADLLRPTEAMGDQPPQPPPLPVPTSTTSRRRRPPPPSSTETQVQTDISGPISRAFTRVEPEVRVERHLVRGPYFCLPDRPVVHFREDCWAFRHVDRRRLERRTLCEVCVNNGQPQYPVG